jgi:predicted RNA-binding protein with PIN domain
MAKRIILDGFNVIRRSPTLLRVEKEHFQNAQRELLEQLVLYRQATGHQISVIFDAAKSRNAFRSRSVQQGIKIVYSAQAESADEVIVEMVQAIRAQTSGTFVVTADRALAVNVMRFGVQVIDPQEFLSAMRKAQSPPRPIPPLDFVKSEEAGWVGHTKKRGNPRRLAKNQRAKRSLLKA